MTGLSIATRLNHKFKVVCSCAADKTVVQLSGPLETQDELDALVEALAVMREWLGTEPREDAAAETDQSERTGA